MSGSASERSPIPRLGEQEMRGVFGRLILHSALVWAATMLAAAVAAKATDEFIAVLFVLIAGFVMSSAVIESARRRALGP